MIYCGLFTALIEAGAFIKIPIPVVPFTLQYLFTMLAGLFLGSRRGMISVVAYMLLGLAGLPIFSEGGGIWYINQTKSVKHSIDVSHTPDITQRFGAVNDRSHLSYIMKG